jgi:hypothetical protein
MPMSARAWARRAAVAYDSNTDSNGVRVNVAEAEPIAVWEHDGVPSRFVFRGIRWRSSQPAVPLVREPEHCPPELTHPPARHVGWRVSARADDGRSISVDLMRADGAWVVERVGS